MWHEFVCLRQQPPLPLSHWWKRRREGMGGIDPGIWRGFFWNESSKELPAACINRPQLAQRGNSICRELCCILFIEELLVIRPYTTSRPKHQATQQEVQTFFFYKIVPHKWSPSHHPIQKGGKKIFLTRAQLVPVSWDGVLFVQQSWGSTLTLPQQNLLRRCNPI